MKTLSLLVAGLLNFAAVGLAAGGAAPGVGTSGAVGGGHGGSTASVGHTSGASLGGGSRSAALGGGYRTAGITAGGGRASFGGSAGMTPSRGISSVQAGYVRALPQMPTVHNAWSDPVSPRVAGNSASAYAQNSQASNLRVGNNLYPGAYGYVPTRPASGNFNRGQGRNNGERGNRRFYNNFPYPVYYPYLYGGYGGYGYGGLGYDGTVGDYAGLNTDNDVADLGAPDFSVPSNNYYSYVSPTQGAPNTDRPAAVPSQTLPDAPAVGPQNPPTAAANSNGNAQQGPDSLVEAVQEELGKRGYFDGKPDAVYSAATKEAIRRFQTDQGLPVTGRINEATLHALHLD